MYICFFHSCTFLHTDAHFFVLIHMSLYVYTWKHRKTQAISIQKGRRNILNNLDVERKKKKKEVWKMERNVSAHGIISFFLFYPFLLFFISFQWKEVKSCLGPWHFWPSGQHSMKKLTTQVTCQSNFFHWMDTHIHTLYIPVSTIIIVTTIIVVVIIIRNLLL